MFNVFNFAQSFVIYKSIDTNNFVCLKAFNFIFLFIHQTGKLLLNKNNWF